MFESCKEKEACDAIKIDPLSAQIRWAYPNNWTEKYDYYCDKSHLRDLAITVALVLSTVICLGLLSSADKLGRKTVVMMTSLLIVTGMSIAVIHPRAFGKIIGIGIALGAEGTFTALFSILINETTCKFDPCLVFKNVQCLPPSEGDEDKV